LLQLSAHNSNGLSIVAVEKEQSAPIFNFKLCSFCWGEGKGVGRKFSGGGGRENRKKTEKQKKDRKIAKKPEK